jgi:streptogramin lyase
MTDAMQPPDTEEGWETPGSSGATATAVGIAATVGAFLAVLAANVPLPLPDLEKYAWIILPAVAGVGAMLGGWVGWKLFGKA